MTAGRWPEHPSFRFLIHRLLRREQLCPQPIHCAEAQIEDPFAAPDERQPCGECPLALLNSATSDRMGLFQAVIDLDFAVERGLRVGLDEISYLEFGLMRILAEERRAFDDEESEKKRRGR